MGFKSRKFLFGIFVLIVSTIMVYVGSKLTGGQWVDLIKWIGSAYFLTNAAVAIGGKSKSENGTEK